MREVYQQLYQALGADKVRFGEPMDCHTTFRAGGRAACFVEPESGGELARAVHLLREAKTPYYILGKGSNLLVSDKGYNGVILSMGPAWNYCRVSEQVITAGAGAPLSRIAKEAFKAELTGLEFAAGIPGSLGGAVVMNAGAYGGEMKHVIQSVKVMTPEGEFKELTVHELEMGYRTSIVLRREYIVLEALIGLEKGDRTRIKEEMDRLALQRKTKQPLEYPSAGSTFKRPAGYFAGKLIEDAGLRGYQVGGAQVSEKHCGFVINRGDATASDIMRLCMDVKQKVEEKFGVDLELEVKTLGEF